ncbi:MAG: epoxyqueuosine reductase QueH [Parasporobacterium sp.]|nr:epoxyqueuosine reductase QueH [Parasporobacterium sp.]
MENKKNYQLELDRIIKDITDSHRVPTLLLHSCCGPCSSYVVTYLMKYFDVTVLYYNPSIYPEEEYIHRYEEQKRLLHELGIPLKEIGYDHESYLKCVKGLESETEGGGRCRVCFEQRIRKTAELAEEGGFDYFCTTLTVSPHKNARIINEVGMMAEAFCSKTRWLPSDFKKREGYKKSVELSAEYGLYRQDYCGCEYSKR